MATLTDWLLDPATRPLEPAALLEAFGAELRRRGIPVARITTSVMTKNPQARLQNLTWSVRSGVTVRNRAHEFFGSADYRGSIAAVIRDGLERIHCRLDSPEAARHHRLLALRDEGLVDYLAFAVVFGDGLRSFVSFATEEPAFSAAAVDALEGCLPALGLRLELAGARLALGSLLEVYLGNNAAARVLGGAFRRGGGESIRAAIWFCDMRDFTHFADSHRPEEVVGELDRLFEEVTSPITSRGGEILKFVGDAVLAVFPAGEDPADACQRARAAAEEALVRVAAMSPREGASGPPRIGIALHLGDVFYGNIGAGNRLDFTVIGAAVNETCRVEGLTKPLETPLLMTAAFAAKLPATDLASLGSHTLKGVSLPLEVFAIRGAGRTH